VWRKSAGGLKAGGQWLTSTISHMSEIVEFALEFSELPAAG
jgi:hypothetical protein